MSAARVAEALRLIQAIMADLGIDELEELAITASEIRRQAWEIRAVKQARVIQSRHDPVDTFQFRERG